MATRGFLGALRVERIGEELNNSYPHLWLRYEQGGRG